ncbi:MAG: hypothetical protein CO042_01465 [Parcubacteria group bacterium CG_4_9_14_0_2_um_filter_41_8]|nr:MAG: hypothetical protein COW93_00790 [Parcubacteria group bacterium CG22_combo_CG10-13_8_21_14_all_41_9]PIZ81340.1 MAG: hypothetical protein COY02_02575 [Parcubacteria group bacterium CG_4_10_14_0_2_um_filter_41_6]PJC40871.1 MAG: hypothetical protein CO042_01465 [Parcubacteria group bacterium CG_4_9_14_0_2_um_filter_41_8]
MRITIFFVALAAMLVDFFLARSSSSMYFNVGFLIIIFLSAHRRYNDAIFMSITYGFFLDFLSPITPFGTFIIAHFVIYLILRYATAIFSNVSNVALLAVIFLSSVSYILVLSIFEYIGINIFTQFSADFVSLFSASLAFKSAILSCVFVLCFIVFARFSANMFGKLFFIK